MRKRRFASAFTSVAVISVLVLVTMRLVIHNARLIGPAAILLGFVPWLPLKLGGRGIASIGADIVFGAIDTGMLGVAALIGASFAGVLGAIVGGAIGDAITDGFAGLFEGKIAESMRGRQIEEARTVLSSSMGKMSGCLFGVGVVLTIAWTFLGIPLRPN